MPRARLSQPNPRTSTPRSSRYGPGDYLKIELSSGSPHDAASLWLRVDHCDDRHGIVFGTIDSEPPQELGKRFRQGVKLAASYLQVREHRLKAG